MVSAVWAELILTPDQPDHKSPALDFPVPLISHLHALQGFPLTLIPAISILARTKASTFQATNPADRGNGAGLSLALLFPTTLEPYELDVKELFCPAKLAWLPCHKPRHQSAELFGRRGEQ